MKTKNATERLCFRIAEDISESGSLDIEDLYQTLITSIPFTRDELHAAMEEISSHELTGPPPQPSPMKKIRSLVHATDDMSMRCVLEAVIKKLSELEELEHDKG